MWSKRLCWKSRSLIYERCRCPISSRPNHRLRSVYPDSVVVGKPLLDRTDSAPYVQNQIVGGNVIAYVRRFTIHHCSPELGFTESNEALDSTHTTLIASNGPGSVFAVSDTAGTAAPLVVESKASGVDSYERRTTMCICVYFILRYTMRLGIILETNNPERVWNGFRLANTALDADHTVEVFLLGDGVKAPDLEHEKFNPHGVILKFAQNGGTLLACGTCLDSRDLEPDDLRPRATMQDCLGVVEGADKVLTIG